MLQAAATSLIFTSAMDDAQNKRIVRSKMKLLLISLIPIAFPPKIDIFAVVELSIDSVPFKIIYHFSPFVNNQLKFFDRKFRRRVWAIFSEKSKRKAKLLLFEIDGFPFPKQVKKLSRFRKKRRRKINFPFYSRQSSKIVTLVLWFMI